jgi:hypothetical protein
MSGGEQQMLTVARTLMGNPLLVLLDEPPKESSPLIVEQMANTIVALKQQGCRFSCRSRISASPSWSRDRAMCSERACLLARQHGGTRQRQRRPAHLSCTVIAGHRAVEGTKDRHAVWQPAEVRQRSSPNSSGKAMSSTSRSAS